jgi:hypothetical protein
MKCGFKFVYFFYVVLNSFTPLYIPCIYIYIYIYMYSAGYKMRAQTEVHIFMKEKLRGLNLRANYTDTETADCRRS